MCQLLTAPQRGPAVTPAGSACSIDFLDNNRNTFYEPSSFENVRFLLLKQSGCRPVCQPLPRLEGDTIKTIGLPCSGKVDVPYLIKAFETGADGVAIVTCPKNECRHFEGNRGRTNAPRPSNRCWRKLACAAGRMAVFECGQQGAGQVLGEIKQFIDRVRNLPPHPPQRRRKQTGEHGCMKADSKLAKKIETGDFIVTAECAPGATATGAATEAALKCLNGKLAAVNMADNSHGVAMSSVAASGGGH